MSNKLYVLFLDIDGVLVTEHDAKRRQKKSLPREDEFGPLFDERCVKNLTFHTLFPIHVVLTSTWRYQGLEAMQQMWTKRNMPFQLMGITPMHAADEAMLNGADAATCRAIEIRAWLDEHPKVYKYVIVDDEPIADEDLFAHLVRTDPRIGISEHDSFEIWNRFRFTSYLVRPNYQFLGDYSLEKLVEYAHDGLLYSDNADIPHVENLQPMAEMDRLMEQVVNLASHGKQQLALCYGLSMLISFQSNKAFFWLRHEELCGLLCQIAIDLKEKELAKMILRIASGLSDYHVDEDVDENYNALEGAIDEIPAAEAVDNRLLYLELMCELRRHWAYSEEELYYAIDDRSSFFHRLPSDCGLSIVTDSDAFAHLEAEGNDMVIDSSQYTIEEVVEMIERNCDDVDYFCLRQLRDIKNTSKIPSKLILREAAYAHKTKIFAYFEQKNPE